MRLFRRRLRRLGRRPPRAPRGLVAATVEPDGLPERCLVCNLPRVPWPMERWLYRDGFGPKVCLGLRRDVPGLRKAGSGLPRMGKGVEYAKVGVRDG